MKILQRDRLSDNLTTNPQPLTITDESLIIRANATIHYAMNEQRAQAYLNLINRLLSCNNGDEPRILQENLELVDEGLVEVMVAVAQQLGEAGRENEGQWLMNMAQQLAQALGLLDSEPSSISTETFDQTSHTVYVLLYNAGKDNEGIHTISKDDKHTILIFESSADATNFARQLEEQSFPVPSVEAVEYENILGFCQQQGYDWDLVPEEENRNPPREGVIFNQATSELNDSKPSLKIEYLELIHKILST
ncbi:MAG: DUF3110 domain-containing protein, partial [Dolichospermum sp.]